MRPVTVCCAVLLAGCGARTSGGSDGAPAGAMGSVAAGCAHSCAITSDGGVACWGANAQGALGLGRLSPEEGVTRVPGLRGVARITAGCYFTCALLADATVRCWGDGGDGKLGDGTEEDRNAPVSPRDLRDVARISAGDSHACAVVRDGGVRCWGDGSGGKLGNGTEEDVAVPTPVAGIADAVNVSAGERATCAVLRSGQALCWGDNHDGELGTGEPPVDPSAPPRPPARVAGITAATGIASASNRGAALLRDGTVRTWGMSPLPGMKCTSRSIPGPSGVIQSYCTTPQPLPGVTGARAVALSAGISAVLLGDGRVLTWDGYFGRMPTAIPEIDDAVDLGLGQNHACVRRRGGGIRCWGRGEEHREIGGGAPTHTAGPNAELTIADVAVPLNQNVDVDVDGDGDGDGRGLCQPAARISSSARRAYTGSILRR